MPLIKSTYTGPPKWQLEGHMQTIAPNMLRRVEPVAFVRRRLELDDGDFLDLDFSFPSGKRGLLIIGHGLEGNAQRPYVTGMAHYFGERDYQICAINFRSCSGQLNRLPRMYHHGDYPDLQAAVEFVRAEVSNLPIFYVGFSMGGNIGLNYAARCPSHAANYLNGIATFSSPLALEDSIRALEESRLGHIYSQRFRNSIGVKLLAKSSVHDIPNLNQLDDIRNWDAFDRAFSLPLHGFPKESVPQDFYDSVSPVEFLKDVRIPTLIVQALNDPMLSGDCYATHFADNPYVHLELPKKGGHVGFALPNNEFTYAEIRTFEFVDQIAETFVHS